MDNSGLEFLAKLLTTYGPGAGAVFLVFFAERRLRNAKQEAQPGEERNLFAWLYVGQWILVGGLLIASTTFWLYWQKRHDPLSADHRLTGSIIDLKTGEMRSRSRDGDFYYSIFYPDKEKYTYDFNWIYLSTSSISKIEFRFVENSSTEMWQDYQLTESDFSTAHDPTNLEFKYTKGILSLQQKDQTFKPLNPIATSKDEAFLSEPPRSNFSLVTSAHAADEPDLASALASDDSFIRQDARIYLYRHLPQYIDWINHTLGDPHTSERVITGIISALATASSPTLVPVDQRPLTPEATLAVIRASAATDEYLSSRADRYLIRNANNDTAQLYEKELKRELEAKGEAQNLSTFAYAGLKLYYNIGDAYRVAAQRGGPDTSSNFEKAIASYARAWDLRQYARDSDKAIQFAQALYGWGLTLHFEHATEGSGKAVSQADFEPAKKKFMEFLQYVEPASGNSKYAYAHHILQAKCYVSQPGQGCLDRYAPPS